MGSGSPPVQGPFPHLCSGQTGVSVELSGPHAGMDQTAGCKTPTNTHLRTYSAVKIFPSQSPIEMLWHVSSTTLKTVIRCRGQLHFHVVNLLLFNYNNNKHNTLTFHQVI